MKADDFAKVSESFRIRYEEFEATGLPAVICAIGVVLVARGIANLLTNNAEAALRTIIFARTPPRPSTTEPRTESRRTVS